MASEGPPRAEAIHCVRVPCREGRERVWQAIELLRQGQHHPQQPTIQPTFRTSNSKIVYFSICHVINGLCVFMI